MNLVPSAKERQTNKSVGVGAVGGSKERRTARQIFTSRLCQAHVVDAAVGRVIVGLPVPPLVEIVAGPLVLEIEYVCSSKSCERVR
jgi:hypothetical protein